MKRGRKPIPHEFFDGVEHKQCRECYEFKPLEEFYANQQSWDGKCRLCRDCHSSESRAIRLIMKARGHVSVTKTVPGQRYTRLVTLSSGRRLKARLYQIWDSMKKRCEYPLQNRYERYGGRGIRVCSEWQSYDAFRAWAVSNGYAKDLSLDRTDFDGHYEPANCRWIPISQQQWNSSRTIHFTLNGVKKPLPVWARELGVSLELLRIRHRKGWPDEHVLTIPKGGRCPGMAYQKPGRKPAHQGAK